MELNKTQTAIKFQLAENGKPTGVRALESQLRGRGLSLLGRHDEPFNSVVVSGEAYLYPTDSGADALSINVALAFPEHIGYRIRVALDLHKKYLNMPMSTPAEVLNRNITRLGINAVMSDIELERAETINSDPALDQMYAQVLE
jgi:E3 ubiquitin-protein ligase DOA10